ncbi:hypothetical protein [Neotabrizicola sp. sgz301269]|uniref:hypothetical protein n=1 Tax=Neotabrizicola sp. sgz301269 TaxID=3276282 RepID=UPI00376FA589
MSMPGQQRVACDSIGFALLCQHAVSSVLTKTDRRALVDHIRRAEMVGAGALAMAARLLGLKLLYASVLDDGKIDTKCAAGGSRVIYAIDERAPQSGRLFHYDEFAVEDCGIHVGSLLGATLIGMKAGTHGPLLQPDGTCRRVHLISVGSRYA